MKIVTYFSGSANKFLKSLTIVVGLFCVSNEAVHGQAVTCPPNIDFENGDLLNWECWLGDQLPEIRQWGDI